MDGLQQQKSISEHTTHETSMWMGYSSRRAYLNTQHIKPPCGWDTAAEEHIWTHNTSNLHVDGIRQQKSISEHTTHQTSMWMGYGSRRAYLNTQHIKPPCGWATAAEEHILNTQHIKPPCGWATAAEDLISLTNNLINTEIHCSLSVYFILCILFLHNLFVHYLTEMHLQNRRHSTLNI